MTEQTMEEQKITKDMLIGDAVQEYPHAAEVLLQNGVHCVGCGGAYMETIEQGLKGHGMSDEAVERIVVDLNAAIPESVGDPKDVSVTKPAVAKVKEFMAQQGVKPGSGLRIRVDAGGCSGFQYALLFDAPTSKDKVFDIEDVKIIMDEESFDHLKGIKIDFIEGLQGAGFKITNPNATNTCGCGDSFH